jgi:hypothetical protein
MCGLPGSSPRWTPPPASRGSYPFRGVPGRRRGVLPALHPDILQGQGPTKARLHPSGGLLIRTELHHPAREGEGDPQGKEEEDHRGGSHQGPEAEGFCAQDGEAYHEPSGQQEGRPQSGQTGAPSLGPIHSPGDHPDSPPARVEDDHVSVHFHPHLLPDSAGKGTRFHFSPGQDPVQGLEYLTGDSVPGPLLGGNGRLGGTARWLAREEERQTAHAFRRWDSWREKGGAGHASAFRRIVGSGDGAPVAPVPATVRKLRTIRSDGRTGRNEAIQAEVRPPGASQNACSSAEGGG